MRKLEVILGIIFVFCLSLFFYFYPTRIVVYGKRYKVTNNELNLCDVKIDDVNELIYSIPDFNRLKTVKLSDGSISYSDKYKLISKYPTINFEVVSYVDLYGLQFLDNEEEINLSNVKIDDTFLFKIGMFKDLKRVILFNQELSREKKEDFQKYYPNIEFVWEENIVGMSVASNIQSLDLSNKTIENKEEFTQSLKYLPKLKTLDMSYTNFSNEELGSLREMYPSVDIDWVLKLSRWSFRTDVISFSVLITHFEYTPIVSEDLEIFKYCRNMQALDLGHQHITDISAISKYLPELRVLILADNRITDISPLAELKHLSYIELFMNKITDISPLAECKELKDINICYNPNLTDISPLFEIPSPERIWLVNLKIPKTEIQRLQLAYPNTQISLYGNGSTDGGWRIHEKYFEMIKMFKKRTYKSSKYFNLA